MVALAHRNPPAQSNCSDCTNNDTDLEDDEADEGVEFDSANEDSGDEEEIIGK